MFLLTLNLPRKTARRITDQVLTILISVVFAELKVNLQNVAGLDIVSETEEQVKWFFARINTEHKLYKELEKRGFYRGFYIVPPNSQGEDRFKNHPVCPN
jgi:hypothetical protein